MEVIALSLDFEERKKYEVNAANGTIGMPQQSSTYIQENVDEEMQK